MATTTQPTRHDTDQAALAHALATLHPRTAQRIDQLVHSGHLYLDAKTAPEHRATDAYAAGDLQLPWMEAGARLRLIVSNGTWQLRYRRDAWSASRAMTIARAQANCAG